MLKKSLDILQLKAARRRFQKRPSSEFNLNWVSVYSVFLKSGLIRVHFLKVRLTFLIIKVLHITSCRNPTWPPSSSSPYTRGWRTGSTPTRRPPTTCIPRDRLSTDLNIIASHTVTPFRPAAPSLLLFTVVFARLNLQSLISCELGIDGEKRNLRTSM
jgi:hypothetical protein